MLMEFVLEEGADLCHKQLEECGFPRDSILVAVIRGEEIIIPRGQTRLQPDDHLVVFALKSAIKDVHGMFK